MHLDQYLPKCSPGFFPMTSKNRLLWGSFDVNHKVLFVSHGEIGEALAEIRLVVIAEGISNYRKRYQLVLKILNVEVQLRPVLAREKRVTAHRIGIRKLRD